MSVLTMFVREDMLNKELGDMLNKENGKYSMKVIYMLSMELCKKYIFVHSA